MTHFLITWLLFIFGITRIIRVYVIVMELAADSFIFIFKKMYIHFLFYNKLKMEDQSLHFRHISLCYIRKGKNARKACEKL